MTARTGAIIVDARLEAAYNSAPKTKQKKAISAFRRALRENVANKQASRLSRIETELFLRINRNLTPEKQRRYDELKEKREDETLAESEHAELLQFVEEIQDIWADRLQAILELAKLRKISPQEMMRQLGVDPEKYG
jgi:transcriptional regulator of met regulon